MKINVGDYVRTKDGRIFRWNKLCTISIEDYMEHTRKILYIEDEIKSSPNIIDLIEVGDYVNGVEVIDLADGIHLEFANNVSYVDVGLATYRDGHVEGIETIVTKEQFESMEYKVGE